MGSGAVMTAAIRNPDRYAATIAVSPTSAEVTPDAPRNLLLQAGGWEGRFVATRRSCSRRGAASAEDFAGGRARQLTVIPNAEHITILFRGQSHRVALDWLANAFGEPRVTAYVDRRIIWYGLSLLGWLLALVALAPVLRPAVPEQAPGTRWLSWVALPVSALIASGTLALINPGVSLSRFGGLMVGGAVGLWFLVAGLIWLPSIRSLRRPSLADLAWGVGLFAVLAFAFGVMAHYVWLPWWLNLPRLARWPLSDAGEFAVVPCRGHGAARCGRGDTRDLVAGSEHRGGGRAVPDAGAGAFARLPLAPAAAAAAAVGYCGRSRRRVGPRVGLRPRRRALHRVDHRRGLSLGLNPIPFK